MARIYAILTYFAFTYDVKSEKRKGLIMIYRSAAETVGDRMHKKLTEAVNVNWYRKEREKKKKDIVMKITRSLKERV